MKDKPIVIIITLVAGLAACICCIINGAGLLATLVAVLVSLLVFMIIGMIVNAIIAKQRREAEERAKDEKMKAEEEARKSLQAGSDEENSDDPEKRE